MKSKPIFKHQAPLGYLIHEVARLMKRRFEDQAGMHGITLPQWRTLAQIAAHEGITQIALANALDIDPMTISGILDRLDKRGLIERYTDPSDSRARLARPTTTGVEMYDTARTLGMAMYESALDGVSPADRETVINVLATMRKNLSGQPAELEEA